MTKGKGNERIMDYHQRHLCFVAIPDLTKLTPLHLELGLMPFFVSDKYWGKTVTPQ
jgi:hypothetical protein